jgi:hypothetical protein
MTRRVIGRDGSAPAMNCLSLCWCQSFLLGDLGPTQDRPYLTAA